MPTKNAKKTLAPKKSTINRKRTGQKVNGPPVTNLPVLAPREVLASIDNNVSHETDNARVTEPTVTVTPVTGRSRPTGVNTQATASTDSPASPQATIRITSPQNLHSRVPLRPSLHPLSRDAAGRPWQPAAVIGRPDAGSIPTVSQTATTDDGNEQDLRTALANARAALLTESRARVQAESRASRLESEQTFTSECYL